MTLAELEERLRETFSHLGTISAVARETHMGAPCIQFDAVYNNQRTTYYVQEAKLTDGQTEDDR